MLTAMEELRATLSSLQAMHAEGMLDAAEFAQLKANALQQLHMRESALCVALQHGRLVPCAGGGYTAPPCAGQTNVHLNVGAPITPDPRALWHQPHPMQPPMAPPGYGLQVLPPYAYQHTGTPQPQHAAYAAAPAPAAHGYARPNVHPAMAPHSHLPAAQPPMRCVALSRARRACALAFTRPLHSPPQFALSLV